MFSECASLLCSRPFVSSAHVWSVVLCQMKNMTIFLGLHILSLNLSAQGRRQSMKRKLGSADIKSECGLGREYRGKADSLPSRPRVKKTEVQPLFKKKNKKRGKNPEVRGHGGYVTFSSENKFKKQKRKKQIYKMESPQICRLPLGS